MLLAASACDPIPITVASDDDKRSSAATENESNTSTSDFPSPVLSPHRSSDTPEESDPSDRSPRCFRYPTKNFCGCYPSCHSALVPQHAANKVIDGLFIGAIQSAYHVQYGNNDYGVTHIVDVSGYQYHRLSSKYAYLVVPVVDSPQANISIHFNRSNGFIDRGRDGGGGVLVHCVAGVSRCCALVSAYLMWKMRLSAREALEHVQSARPTAKPNAGFMKQLERYEKQLSDKWKQEDSAAMRALPPPPPADDAEDSKTACVEVVNAPNADNGADGVESVLVSAANSADSPSADTTSHAASDV